ncbi:SIS domain-containing protein [Cellulomonas alba]|uniref:SIS domain-containing protein n=1 Tax=Cellulomonas alba TaxID=3053467 RepID=A0ABT7SIJ9_9CELL|nr:SIS domain-containing protein [Cellulomonas alba]MDM7856011.1 SIS domain-containing protein [Cellulomonas alba]
MLPKTAFGDDGRGTLDERAGATGREIAQQPAVWRRLAADLAGRRETVRGFLEPLLSRGDLRIVLTGAGTSAFAGELLAPALARALSRTIDAVATTAIVTNPREAFVEDVPTLLVSFARSGDSPESVAATELADRCLSSVYHLIVTCNAEGHLARTHSASERSLVLLMPPESHDEGFAMTSSFTSMVLATWLALVPSGLDSGVAERLAEAGAAVLRRTPDDVAKLAARGYDRVVYLGSGSLAALARESALKVLELTAGEVVSYSDSSLGFRHGPKSVVNDRTLAIVYLSNDPYVRLYDEDIVAELQAQMGSDNVVVVGASPSAALEPDGPWAVPHLAEDPDALVGLVFVLVAQLLAMNASLELGIKPDTPWPDGQVNRVVQGVTVHPFEADR